MTSREREARAFLEWALPRLRLRWEGFEGVHGQVRKRIVRRARELGLEDFEAYRAFLEESADEWKVLDSLCHVTISRFYRERAVFDLLRDDVFPARESAALARDDDAVRVLCLGAAGGEEPYSLRIAWDQRTPPPRIDLSIVAIEADHPQLERARVGRYPASAISELPESIANEAFERDGAEVMLRESARRGVEIREGDVRDAWPEGRFDVITCRNLVFTYFEEALQNETLARIERALVPRGVLVIGRQERLPTTDKFIELAPGSNVWRLDRG
ncbi:MAG: methyltransferase domain-containing protein [Polyangiaceae bacterium]|nr:methyltransferase domain-containing protein [Polyangiaceae bacterium]